MEFSELLVKRRSIRNFQDREVPLSLLLEIIKISCLAPNASNRQPWRFIIVSKRDRIEKLAYESKSNLLKDLDNNPTPLLKKYETILRNERYNVFYNAPCLIYITGPKEVRSLDVDCALAASYLMLAATTRGLGTCWVALGSRIKDPDILKEIRLPADHRIVAPIIVGYPEEIPEPPKRNEPQIFKIIQ